MPSTDPRTPSTDPRTPKNVRREQARAHAAQVRAQQERTRRRHRLLALTGLGLAVAALGVAVAISLHRADAPAATGIAYPSPDPSLAQVRVPSTADATGGVPVSAKGAGVAAGHGVRVDLYFDAMCSACGQFDRINADDLAALAAEDGVTLVYHPVAILDRLSQGNLYSTRAANAVGVVADADAAHLPAFVTALYATGTQPAEGSTGLDDARLTAIARAVGVPTAVTDRFTAATPAGRTFAGWVAVNTAALPAAADGKRYTPTIVLDGTYWTGNWSTPGALRSAVESAARADR